MTPGSGCFAMAHKKIDRRTDGHGDYMTELAQRANSVKITFALHFLELMHKKSVKMQPK